MTIEKVEGSFLPSRATVFIDELVGTGEAIFVPPKLRLLVSGNTVSLEKDEIPAYQYGFKRNRGVISLLTRVKSPKGVYHTEIGYFPVLFGTHRDMGSNSIGLSKKYEFMVLKKVGNKQGIAFIVRP